MRVAITIKGRAITLDFTGSAPEQAGPTNGRIALSTLAASRAAVKALTTPELPANEGFYGAIDVIAPQGTVVNAGPSAPTFLYAWVAQIILDLVNEALHEVLPEKSPPYRAPTWWDRDSWAWSRAREGTGGPSPRASWGSKGENSSPMVPTTSTPSPQGPVRTQPTEVSSQHTPSWSNESNSYRTAAVPAGGEGAWARRTCFKLLTPATFFSFIEKGKTPHWGIFGGKDGLRNYALIQSKEKGEFEVLKHPGVELQADDRVIVTAGGGGGYGDPLERDPEAVRRDVIQGYVSIEHARLDYGVVLAPNTL